METTIHKKSQVLRELEIMVPEEEIQKAFTEAYQAIRPKMAVPGFRSGKAPLSVIKKMHGDAIERDTLECIAQEKFKTVVEEQKLEPIGTPVMTDLHRHHGEGAHFRISYEVKPDITLNNYEGTEVEQPIFTVTDEDVNERIHYLQFNYSTKEATQHIADTETIVSLSFVDPASGGNKESTTVYLHDPQIVAELRNAILGKNVGDAFEVDLPLSGEPGAEKRPVSVTIDAAEKVTLPVIDEEFCKKISRDKAATELEVRMMIREELELQAKRKSEEAVEGNMVQALLSKHEFDVPNTYTYAIIDSMIAELKEENKRKGYPEDYGINVEEYRKLAWSNAELRAKWLLLRDKMVTAMDIDATEEELTKLAETDAAQYGIAKENLLKYYLSNEEIKERIRSQKLVEKLKQQFVIKEKAL